VDIGANFGVHTLLACGIMGESGQVIAVEPVPSNLRLLRRNLKLNGFSDRCTVIAKALTDGSVETVEMTIEPGLSLVASLAPNSKGEKLVVPATTLDEVLSVYARAPDLVKIDVEGAEHEVLKGAENTLRIGPTLLLEIHCYALPEFNSTAEALNRFLGKHGYKEQRLGVVNSELGATIHSIFTKKKQ
jgi:FkbM family methyltransferase